MFGGSLGPQVDRADRMAPGQGGEPGDRHTADHRGRPGGPHLRHARRRSPGDQSGHPQLPGLLAAQQQAAQSRRPLTYLWGGAFSMDTCSHSLHCTGLIPVIVLLKLLVLDRRGRIAINNCYFGVPLNKCQTLIYIYSVADK